MCRKLIYLIPFVLVLSLANYASAQVDANFPLASTAPAIDGDFDNAWLDSDEHRCLNVTAGDPCLIDVNSADLSISWWALWDEDNLYLFVDVCDDDLRNDDTTLSYQDDSVEIMIDIANDKETSYVVDDYQYRIAWNYQIDPVPIEEYHGCNEHPFEGVEFEVKTKDANDGYTLEIKYPWTTLNHTNRPDVNGLYSLVGLDLQVNDDDGGGDRDHQVCWHDTAPGAVWNNPNLMGTVQLVANVKASSPTPPQGSENALSGITGVQMEWLAGRFAASHDVYFGTTSPPDSIGNQSGTMYERFDLDPETTYYWRIDEVNVAGPDPCLWVGDEWSFTTASSIAHSPSPPNDARWIDVNDDLFWGAGWTALSHDVYFGTDPNPPLVEEDWPTTTYDPGTLEAGQVGTTYYWHIDEYDGITTYPGDLWSFTTLAAGAGIIGEYFTNIYLGGTPEFTRLDYDINFNWGQGAPFADPAITDNWSVRWTAELDVPSADTYTFTTTRSSHGMDGVRLWVNGVLIIDNWEGTGEMEDSNDIYLENEPVLMIMEFVDGSMSALAKLSWECSTIEREIIPRDYFFQPRRSVSPNPAGGATQVQCDPNLTWVPGMYADRHDVYFGTDEADLVLVSGDQDANTYEPDLLEFNTTYYWRIDDNNDSVFPFIWQSSVWSFTTGGFLIVDDMEDYINPDITTVWKDSAGNPDITTSTDPLTVGLIHGGSQAMAYSYDNSASPYYTEAYADTNGPNTLGIDPNWRLRDVKALSLWFHGIGDLTGSFTEAAGTYKIEADGKGIGGGADYCHYVYREVSEYYGMVTAKVVSVEDTDPWSKAGVMIRDSLDPDAKFMAVVVTPQKVVFQYRSSTGGSASSVSVSGITAPLWVRVYRTAPPPYPAKTKGEYAEDFNGEPNLPWTQIGNDVSFGLSKPTNLGLCVTSSSFGQMCTARISNVEMQAPPGINVNPPAVSQDIGRAYNDPESMYVVLQDSDSNAIVEHPDPNVTRTGAWTEWRIDMNDFNNQGVELTDVQRMYIGFGDRDNPELNGSGTVFIDDIRLYLAEFYEPECPWPPDIVRDGSIDYRDIGLAAENWLISDYEVTPVVPDPGPVAWYKLEQDETDSSNGFHCTPNGVSVSDYVSVTTADYPIQDGGGYALDLAGDANFIDANDYDAVDYNAVDYGIDGNNPKTIAVWVYTRSFKGDRGIYEIGENSDGRDFSLRTSTETGEPNLWRMQYWGYPDWDIDFTYPSLDRWVHFAHVYDGTTVRVYADGYALAEAERVLDLNTAPDKTFKIGQWRGEYFDGIIDDVRIYDYALSQAQAASLAGKTETFTQPLHLLMTPTNPDIDVYDADDPNTINFRDIAEIGNVWGDTKVWPTW